MSARIERTLDVGLVLTILTNPDILDSISEDGFNVDDLDVNVIKDKWVGIFSGDIEIGAAQFRPMFNKCFDCHIHILPQYRKDYSQEVGVKLLKWCDENLSGSLLYTNVPIFCENVKQYLLSFGFKEIGILEKAWFKNGIQNDMTILTKRAK